MIRSKAFARILSGCLLSVSSAAYAQTSGGTPATGYGPPAATPASAQPESEQGDIVVTARRREETLQDVPMSISVLSGDTLAAQGLKSSDDLYGRVPGLYFTNAGGSAPTSDFIYLVLRGVGANGGQEPAVGVFVDGMYQPQLGFDVGFLDLQRLEVLRGPQGTLFGRNTEAGALNLVTRKPGDKLEGRAELEVGSFDTVRAFGTVRGPITDTISAGITGEYLYSNGFTTNPAPDGTGSPDRRVSVRGTLRFRPTDELDIVLSGDITDRDYNEIGLGAPLSCRCYKVYQDNDRPDHKKNRGIQLNADYSISPSIKLTSITGYRDVSSDITFDYDGRQTDQTPFTANGYPGSKIAPNPITAAGIFQRIGISQRFWSQELRLEGSSSNFDWLVGGYYFEQKQRQQREFQIGAVAIDPSISYLSQIEILEDFYTNRSGYAAFGQAILRPIKGVELTGGLRYANEGVDISGERLRNITQIENAAPTFFVLDGRRRFDNLSWLGSASYKVNRDVLVYATASRGFKAGGFNRFPSQARAAVPYDSETSTNYEIGLKGSILDRRLTANLSAFLVDIQSQQLLTVTPDAAGVPVTTIANAGKSRSKGFEAELFARPVDTLSLSASIAYTDARYVQFSQCAAAGVCISRNGDRFSYVPQWTVALNGEYRIPLHNRQELSFAANYRYVSSNLVDDGNFLADLGATIPVPAYSRLDLRVSYSYAGWKLTGYVNNVTNSFNYTNVAYNSFLPEVPENLYVVPLPPRTFGAMVSYKF
jgi:iron complex outermembrane receptor protein